MVHLFLNCDEYLASLKVAELKAKLGDPQFASLNTTELAGERTSGAEVLALASLMPFLSERRMVIVTGYLKGLHRRMRPPKKGDPAPADDAAPANEDTAEASTEIDDSPAATGSAYQEAAVFLLGLRHLPETADLVLIDAGIDKRSPLLAGFRLPNPIDGESSVLGLLKLGLEPGFLLHNLSAPENKPYSGDDLTQWILAEAKRRAIEIDYSAAQLLAQFVGGDLRRLGHELEKLALFRPGKSIVLEQVRAQVADTSEERFYKLTSALVQRDGREAFRILADLWRAEENPFGLLAAIASNYRTLLRVKALVQQGVREPAELAKTLSTRNAKVSEGRARNLIKDAGRFLAYSELEAILERCFDANMAMISGEDQATQIEILIADLTLPAHRRAA